MKTNIHRVRVGWGDCDPAKIVYYPNYYRWFDDATHALFRSVGLDIGALYAQYDIAGMPLMESSARYLSPSAFGDILEIESGVSSWQRKAFVISHTVTNNGRPAVQGSETRFWGLRHPDDPSRLKAGEIPAEIRRRFGAAEL